MSPVQEFIFLLFCHLMLLLVATGDGNGDRRECPALFECGYIGNISFPFTTTERQDCGLLAIQNCDQPTLVSKRIQLQNKGKWFDFIRKPQISPTSISIHIRDNDFYKLLQSRSCESFRYNYTFPPTFHFASFSVEYNATLFSCKRALHVSPATYVFNYTGCPDYDLYYTSFISDEILSSLAACTMVQLPIKDVPDASDPFTFVTADIITQVRVSDECAKCHYKKRGQCQIDSKSKFCCANGMLQENLETQAHMRALHL